MKQPDVFIVFFQDKGWHVSQEFKSPQKALAFMDEKRKAGLVAYAAHLETVLSHLPALVFIEVENQEMGK